MKTDSAAITADGLGKRYRLGAKQNRSDSLAKTLVNAVKAPIRNYRHYRSLYEFGDVDEGAVDDGASGDILWAIRDVSFEIQPGERVGIIGGNGAGKSTLLKILSRITPPSCGQAKIAGRVSSLLEVGTGFHPELTGRENVYLNSTILGMRKREIDRGFDDIVAFSGVEKFLDTPVKRYSSGMKVRLAFAVAAHLEPEILIVDEVLAVGDAAFQKKCLDKMSQVGKAGRTVLFVSHNMGAIVQLCDRVLRMEGGRLIADGPARSVVRDYLSAGTEDHATWRRPSDSGHDLQVGITAVRLGQSDHVDSTGIIDFDSRANLEILYTVNRATRNVFIIGRVSDAEGNIIWASRDTDSTDWIGRTREPGSYISVCKIPPRLLRPGRYHVSVGALAKGASQEDFHENVLTFDVSEMGYTLNRDRLGVITPILEWDVRRLSDVESMDYSDGIESSVASAEKASP